MPCCFVIFSNKLLDSVNGTSLLLFTGACNNALNFNEWGISDLGDSVKIVVCTKVKKVVHNTENYDAENMHGFYLLFIFSSCHNFGRCPAECVMKMGKVISKHALAFSFLWNLVTIWMLM